MLPEQPLCGDCTRAAAKDCRFRPPPQSLLAACKANGYAAVTAIQQRCNHLTYSSFQSGAAIRGVAVSVTQRR
jgi:hypothetical protein